MKFSVIISILLSTASATSIQLPNEISATSDLGTSLLSSARRLNDNNDDAISYTWMAGYSLKFQGCHHHTTLNLNADDQEDVKIMTVKMAHFRLCPSNSCASWLGGGCNSNYADYVIDLETFAEAYLEGQRRSLEYTCQTYMYEKCDCQESDDRDDGWNREYCEYDCYANNKKMSGCIDRNPYEAEEEGERERRFEAQRYVECKEWEMNEGQDNNNNGNNGDDGEQVQYYIGPYCSAKGGEVYLGLYTDDTCTNFADSNNGKTTFKELSGTALPYSTTSLITSECVGCIEMEDPNRREDENNNNGGNDDAVDEDQVAEQCERLYQSAGKCEQSLSADTLASIGVTANNEGCSYIGGIKFTKTNGVVEKKMSSGDWATIFIVAFAAAFAGLAGVVYKLRKRMIEANKSPLLEREDSQEDSPLA